MTILETALVEVTAELARLAPIHEGLRDYALLDLTPEARVEVEAAIAQYDARVLLLTAVQVAITALLGAGYPAIPIPPVVPAVYADLVANRDTIEAALAEFRIREAAYLTLTWGTPEPSDT